MDNLHIQLNMQDSKGAFYLKKNDQVIGEMTFSIMGPNRWIINHTEVNTQFEGQGLATKLLDFMVQTVREKDVKIIPLCPFVKNKVSDDKEYSDIL